ncbi:hypothetical protein [Noviherbaspirillum denitrificans]|nr:hypothetical protein [Noviherbaspirillum denitrificans]
MDAVIEESQSSFIVLTFCPGALPVGDTFKLFNLALEKKENGCLLQ